MIADDIQLSRAMADAIERHAELQLFTQSLSITTFRYVPPDLRSQRGSAKVEAYLNELNQALLAALERNGGAFLSNALVDGKFLLRACVVNFHTALGDIDALPPLLARLGREVDLALRPERGGR